MHFFANQVLRRSRLMLAGALASLLFATGSAWAAPRILFIGNSFTFAAGSPVMNYRADTVTDLNDEGIGGVPALFKSFTDQAGLAYDVFLETHPGSGIDWHLKHKQGVLGRRPWDVVVMHGFSTLDPNKPGDPALLVATARDMAAFMRRLNASVELRLMATFPRADQVYTPGGAWYGKSLGAMARDVRTGYDQAAKGARAQSVVPVGEAWVRAIDAGVADSNPYDGIDAGKVNLWTYDHYHGSAHGYYLNALVLFGSITGRDPRSLGKGECSANELGFSEEQAVALQQVAHDQLKAAGIKVADAAPLASSERKSCSSSRAMAE